MGNRQQRREVCDAILHGVDAIAVFEVKGVFIADVNVVARDPAIFRAEVLKQYAAPASNGSRRKGVTQLALAVGALSSGETDLDALRRGTTIYPVVTLDSLVSAPGTVDILREAFAGALGATSKTFPIDVNGMRVACLTIMTVSDVELLDHLVETTELLEVLREYTLAENQTAYGIKIHGRQVTEIAEVTFEHTRSLLSGDAPSAEDETE